MGYSAEASRFGWVQVWIYFTWATVAMTLMSMVRFDYESLRQAPDLVVTFELWCAAGNLGAISHHPGKQPHCPAAQCLTFKVWPETATEKSWEHRVHLVALLCCCSRRVSQKSAEDGGSTPLARMALVFASVSVLLEACKASTFTLYAG